MDIQRKEFEEWAKANGYHVAKKPIGEVYLSLNCNSAWKAWQAAKAQAVPSKLDEISNWAKWHIEDYQISESNEHDRGWYNACCAVVNMLEAQEQNQ